MLRIKDFHLLWCNFPDASPHIQHTTAWSYNPRDALPQRGFGLFPVRSPLLGESLLFSFPAGTKMFQFPALASRFGGMSPLQGDGLSHSETPGSMAICA